MFLHGCDYIRHVFALGAGNLDERSWLTLVPHDKGRLLEVIAHFGDVAEPYDRAVAPGEDHHVLEVFLIVGLADGADAYLRLLGVYTAAREGNSAGPDHIRDVLKRQPEGPQPVFRHLDRDLVVAHASRLDSRRRQDRREFVLDLVRQFLK